LSCDFDAQGIIEHAASPRDEPSFRAGKLRIEVTRLRIVIAPTTTAMTGIPMEEPMEDTELLDEIRDANLTYLMLAQRLLKVDRASAQFRLKLDDEMAAAIGSLSSKQMGQLARSNQLLFRPTFRDADQLQSVLQTRLDDSMLQTHAAIVMAGAAA
jgi:flagellar transcriptional activator FlhD